MQETSNLPSPLTLSEASPTSLNELFERDPLELSDRDISVIVDKLREQRRNFLKEEDSAKSEGRRVNAKKLTADPGLKLEDLKLDF